MRAKAMSVAELSLIVVTQCEDSAGARLDVQVV
jgi:hypothetical protein